MKIVWHTIPDYPEYEINRLGQIRRKSTGRVLKPFDDRRGYLRVSLNGRNAKVHILVAKMFVPNPHGYPVVDHKHGDKHDNRASQLEWCTVAENKRRAYALGLCSPPVRKEDESENARDRHRNLLIRLAS